MNIIINDVHLNSHCNIPFLYMNSILNHTIWFMKYSNWNDKIITTDVNQTACIQGPVYHHLSSLIILTYEMIP